MLHIIGELLRNDTRGKEILSAPEGWIKEPNLRIFRNAVAKLFQLLILDIDNFVDDWIRSQDGFFDYKNFFKNNDQVRTMTQDIVTAYKKQLIHHSEDEFSNIYAQCEKETITAAGLN